MKFLSIFNPFSSIRHPFKEPSHYEKQQILLREARNNLLAHTEKLEYHQAMVSMLTKRIRKLEKTTFPISGLELEIIEYGSKPVSIHNLPRK